MDLEHLYMEKLRSGTKVPVAGPIARFILPEKIEQDLCFLATGTGIVPLRSMLYHIINNNIEHKNIYMVLRKPQAGGYFIPG